MGNGPDASAMTRRNRRYAALYRSLTLVMEAGVAAALALLAAGLVMNVFSGGVAAAVMTAGILVLLATPVLAVLVAVVFFAILRDRWCLAASLVIFAVLAASLVLALRL